MKWSGHQANRHRTDRPVVQVYRQDKSANGPRKDFGDNL
jgi:hypothetical protein